MKKITLLFLILISFLICCKTGKKSEINPVAQEEKKAPVDVRFQKIYSVPIPELSTAFVLATGDEIYVYGHSLTDKKKLMRKFDSNLQLTLEKIFPMGQGPGDLGAGTFFSRHGDTFYAFDNTQQRVNLFNKKFEFIRFIKFPQKFQSPVLCEGGEYFITALYKMSNIRSNEKSITNTGAKIMLVKFPGLDNKVLHKFPMEFWMEVKNGKKLSCADNYHQYDYFSRGEDVYIIDMREYILYRYNLDGTLIHSVRLEVETVPVPDSKREEWVDENFSWAKRYSWLKMTFSDYVMPTARMVPLGKGFAVVRRYGYSLECNGMVEADYFNYNLEMMGKIKIPCFSRLFELSAYVIPQVTSFSNGHLYLISQDIAEDDSELYILEKWKVQE